MFVRLNHYLEVQRQAGRAEVLESTLSDVRTRLTAADKEIRRLTTAILRMREQHFELGPETFDDRWPGGKYVMSDVEAETVARQSVYTEYVPGAPLSDEDSAAADREFDQEFAEEIDRLFPPED